MDVLDMHKLSILDDILVFWMHVISKTNLDLYLVFILLSVENVVSCNYVVANC